MTYRAAATLDTLACRAEMLARIRAFFAARGVLEVETPMLSPAGISDPALEPLRASAPGFTDSTLYLRTSPEYAMKRLLAAGAGDIYELGRVFRDGESGRWHAPEFTMLEWYRLGLDETALAEETTELLVELLTLRREAPPVHATTYRAALDRALGLTPESPLPELENALEHAGVAPPRHLDQNALLDLALSTVVAPSFAADALTVVRDFPASQAALAEIKPGDPPVAARFEIFFGAVEFANGYRELTDPAEQRARFRAELERRRRAGRHVPPLDERFLDALNGMPPAAGVSVGIDRVLALTLGFDRLAPALAFTHGTDATH